MPAMIEKRPVKDLGRDTHDWLDARFHFSFANYYDPARMGWGALRVWNDDEIAPGTGFPAHPHRDMEIITYVTKGAISHADSMGNQGKTEAGDVQVMSAGSGIRHAEYNAGTEGSHSFQLWIIPREGGGTPSWGTKQFPKGERAGKFVALASGLPGDDDALPIRADGRVLGATIKAGESTTYRTEASRHLYLVVANGAAEVNGVKLDVRDGAAITGEATLTVKALEDAELVLVDAA